MQYRPRPLDATSHVRLDADVVALTERLAEHIHDVWAAERIQEGWTYGPRKDGDLKQTPSLVPYAELPESEKEYDRKTATEALKFVLAQGYRLSKPPAP